MALDASRVEGPLAEARKFAAKSGLAEQLEDRLRFLERYGGPTRVTRCILDRDFAPHSFTFVMEIRGAGGRWRTWFEGGLIYHGQRDGGGCGCDPTYAVSIEPEHGWVIHT